MAQGYQHFQPPHSDFLIHWTGRDFDDAKTGADSDSSVTCECITKKYLERLKSILDYGLWMTEPEDKDEDEFQIDGCRGSRPRIPRTCFTELKISEVRSHAARYGRLGIGFKRPFVMERGGLPVWYYSPWENRNRWVESLGRENLTFTDKDLYACFLKPMGNGEGMEGYNFLYESEWRIIFADWLLKDKHLAKEPEGTECFGSYAGKRPRYLLPLKRVEWLALIIYPSIQALHAAQMDKKLRELLREIKPEGSPEGHTTKTRPYEKFVLPI
jgi:hypothetical protein